jgi:hypothetical protein
VLGRGFDAEGESRLEGLAAKTILLVDAGARNIFALSSQAMKGDVKNVSKPAHPIIWPSPSTRNSS